MTSIDERYNEAEKIKDAGNYEEAVKKLEEILADDDTHVLTHLALAVLYGKLQQHAKAVSHGEKACTLDPNDAFNFTAMSVTYQRAFAGTQEHRFIQMAEDAMAKAHMLQGR